MAEIRVNATGGLKLYDADDSHYAQIVAGTITSNVDAITLGHDTVTIADNLSLGSDSSVLKFGADGDTTLTHTDGTGLTLNSTNKLCFNDASQYIQGASNAILDIAATDEIELTATLVDLNGNLDVSGTYTGAGLMTTGGNIVIPNAGNIGSASDTDAIAIASNGVTTFSQAPVFPDGSIAVADLDIDGATDIGAAIVDADLFIIDDGAGGTNRKVTASRIKTYAGGAALANDGNNRVVTGDGSGGLNGEANLTFDGTTLAVTGTVEPAGDTAAGDNAAIGYTASEGLILTGQGSGSDVTIKNDADELVCRVLTGTDDLTFADSARVRIGSNGDMSLYHDGSNSYIHNTDAGSIIVYGAQLTHMLKVHNYNGNFQQGGLNMLDVVCAAATTGANFDFLECNANDGDALRLRIADDGDVTSATNSYGSTSDERIKQNIADASSQWDDIKNVKVKKYKLKKDVNQNGEENTPYHLGVIAQDLETDNMSGLVEEGDPCPEDTTLHSDFGTVVAGTADNGAEPIKDEDGNITGYKKVFTPGQKVKAIKYSILYMKAIKALQEVQTRVETLETKVTALEG